MAPLSMVRQGGRQPNRSNMEIKWEKGAVLSVKLTKKGSSRNIVVEVEATGPGSIGHRLMPRKHRVIVTLKDGKKATLMIDSRDIFRIRHTLSDLNQPHNGTQERSDQEGPGQAT